MGQAHVDARLAALPVVGGPFVGRLGDQVGECGLRVGAELLLDAHVPCVFSGRLARAIERHDLVVEVDVADLLDLMASERDDHV